MLDVAIVTEKACLKLNPSIRHNAMAIEEDAILVDAFRKRGKSCERRGWDDPTVDWSSIKVALLKSPWNYFDKIEEFKEWINQLPETCQLINNRSIIRWNLDKKYLWQLRDVGISIPDSYLIAMGSPYDEYEWYNKAGGAGYVIKPTISGGAKDTFFVKEMGDVAQHKEINSAIARQDMILQPFIESILTEGEMSLVYIDGELSHSRRKRPRSGDYRVQPYYGGFLEIFEPDHSLIEFSQGVIAACEQLNTLPMYARVDICLNDQTGLPMLMELEVIEPQLWFPSEPKAVSRLVSRISEKFLF